MNNDCISQEDLMLFGSGSRLVMGSVLFQEGLANKMATFDVFVRDLPQHRSYLVAGGLEHIVQYLQNFHFTKHQLRYIGKNLKLPSKTLSHLVRLRFTGDLYGPARGHYFFSVRTNIENNPSAYSGVYYGAICYQHHYASNHACV